MQSIEFTIPYPKGYKNQLLSLNNLNKIHWSKIKKIKDDLRSLLKGWILEEQTDPVGALEIQVQVIRCSKRKFDAINAAWIIKQVEDILVELNFVKDDDKNKIIILPSKYDPGVVETMIEFKIKKDER